MKKIALIIAAAAAIGVAVPASAQTVVIRDGAHRHHHDGWHRERPRYRAERHHHHRNSYHRDVRRHRSHGPAIVIRP